jgi:hypothetical protein
VPARTWVIKEQARAQHEQRLSTELAQLGDDIIGFSPLPALHKKNSEAKSGLRDSHAVHCNSQQP